MKVSGYVGVCLAFECILVMDSSLEDTIRGARDHSRHD